MGSMTAQPGWRPRAFVLPPARRHVAGRLASLHASDPASDLHAARPLRTEHFTWWLALGVATVDNHFAGAGQDYKRVHRLVGQSYEELVGGTTATTSGYRC